MRGDEGENLGHLLRLEIAQRVGEIFGVDVEEELPQLIGRFFDELLQLGPEERRESHATSLPGLTRAEVDVRDLDLRQVLGVALEVANLHERRP